MNRYFPYRNSVVLRFLSTALSLLAVCGCLFHHQHKQIEASLLDDKVTTTRVEAALEKNPDLRQVHVTTKGGQVTLTGVVKSAAAKQRASEAASKVHRATKLENDIQVRP